MKVRTKVFIHRLLGLALIQLLIGMISCSSVVGPMRLDAEEEQRDPIAQGPYAFTKLVIDSLMPSYMTDVADITLRIPLESAGKVFPTIIVEPGFFSTPTQLNDVQNRYASHGFLVIGVSNLSHFNLITTSLVPYQLALLQTVRYAVESAADTASVLYGLIDTTAIGISGHSMGGGGAIMAADSVAHPYHRYIKAVVAMNPFGRCSARNIGVPTLMVASELDSVFNPFMLSVSSSPEDIYHSFGTLSTSTPRMFTNFKDMDHNAVTDKNVFLVTSGNAELFLPTMLSWFKVYLTRNTIYEKYLDTTSVEFDQLKSRFGSKRAVPGYVYIKQ